MDLKEFKISGKLFLFVLVLVVAISGIVFGTTMLGTSGTGMVSNYDDKIVAATVTSFTADVSSGYNSPSQTGTSSQSTGTGSQSYGTTDSQSSGQSSSSSGPCWSKSWGYWTEEDVYYEPVVYQNSSA